MKNKLILPIALFLALSFCKTTGIDVEDVVEYKTKLEKMEKQKATLAAQIKENDIRIEKLKTEIDELGKKAEQAEDIEERIEYDKPAIDKMQQKVKLEEANKQMKNDTKKLEDNIALLKTEMTEKGIS